MKSILFAAVMACTISLLTTQTALAKTLKVELNIEAVHCMEPSRHSVDQEDQLIILVRGQSPKEDYMKRLPADDNYYRGMKNVHLTQSGWPDRHNKKNEKPILWRGNLREGQTAKFFVVLAAQQSRELAVVSQDLAHFWGTKQITSYVEENKHDVLGSFTVIMKNVAGELQVTWNAGDYTRHSVGDGNAKPFGLDAAFFGLGGPSEASYNMIANAIVK